MSNSLSRTAPWLLALLLIGGGLLSCQQNHSTEPTDNGPFVVHQTWPMEAVRMPDSVSWLHKSTSGTFSLKRYPTDSFRVTDSFPQSIATDTLTMSLWRLGLRTTTAVTVVQADGGLSVVTGKRVIDDNAVDLLRKFDSLRNNDPSTYGAASDAFKAQILSLQKATAALILAKLRTLDTLPKGLDSLAVVAQILVKAAALGSNLATVAKTTGLDTTSLRSLAGTLLKSGVLKASDSTTLFPPYPVRVKVGLSVGSPVVAGGAAVSVQGTFAWTKGARISNPRYAVHTAKGTDSTFEFLLKTLPQTNDTTWSLAGNFSLQAPSSAAPGTDTLVVSLSDDSGRVATARAWFKVEAKDTATTSPTDTTPHVLDTAAPVVNAQSGTKDTLVSWTTKSYSLSWSITDDSALGIVTLNDSLLAGKDGMFQTTVSLKVGSDSFRLVAKDKHGRETKSLVVITRWMDTTTPKISLANPPRDTTVPNPIAQLDVEVTAFDSVGIDSVKINSVLVVAAPYKVSVPLAIGPNVVKALAWDRAGNKSDTISVTIIRAKSPGDTVPPKIQRTAPGQKDTVVGYLTTTANLSYLVTDDSLASVSLDGTTLTGTTGVYQAKVDLSVGLNTFALLALDQHGNPARDTVKITRGKDTTKPVAAWQGASKDSSVWAFVPSVAVTWKVTDNALKLVTINGATATQSGDLYSQTVDLATDVTMIRLMALDSSGNTTTDSVKVTRNYDKTAPTVTFQKTKSRLVANAVTVDTLVWSVSDNLKLKSVKINDSSFAIAGSTYSLRVLLTVGTHRYALVATDSAGNQTFDTAIIARTALPPTHSAIEGRYIGTVYDTLNSPGADSILYSSSLSGGWKKFAGPVVVTTTGTLYAKAFPGELITPINFTISQVNSVAMGGDDFVGRAFSVFVMSDGTAYAAGSNQGNGFGVSFASITGALTPTKIGSGIKWASASHNTSWQSLFLKKTDNTLNAAGEGGSTLALGSATANNVTLTRISLDDVEEVASSAYSYFRKSDGTVWMAGGIDSSAVQIPGLSHMASIAAGRVSTSTGTFNGAGLDSSGNVWTWNYLDSFNFNTDPTTRINFLTAPTIIATGAKAVVFGWEQLLILNFDGTVLGVGSNASGQLGLGTLSQTIDRLTPIPGLTNIVAVTSGSNLSLFLRKDGSLFVAGMIMTYSPPSTGTIYTGPTQIATSVASVWQGVNTFIFKKTDGTMWGAGWNWSGDLGLGYATAAPLPVQINF